jgi:hypothetical protein
MNNQLIDFYQTKKKVTVMIIKVNIFHLVFVIVYLNINLF